MDITRCTERSKKLSEHLIIMGQYHIDKQFGMGTAGNLVKLSNELYDSLQADDELDTEESRWGLDLAMNNFYEELHRGLRV